MILKKSCDFRNQPKVHGRIAVNSVVFKGKPAFFVAAILELNQIPKQIFASHSQENLNDQNFIVKNFYFEKRDIKKFDAQILSLQFRESPFLQKI
jgi:hypothetical protein